MIYRILCCCIFVLQFLLAWTLPAPFVVLPPFLHINAVNKIVVSPVKSKQDSADLQIIVSGYNASRSSLIFTQKLKAKRAGAPHSFSFELTTSVEKAKVEIIVQGHEKFESELRVKPNLAALHIHTDKPIYSAGETVSVRALPLTHSGAIYDGVIRFALVNPDGFELVRKQSDASAGYIQLAFELPKYLFYGEWHILAKPYGVNEPELTYDAPFQVKDYVLPAFKISMFIAEDQLLNATDVTVEARYYYGAMLSGSMTLYCNSRKYRRDSSKPKRLLQSEIHNGLWQHPVDFTPCFSDVQHQSTLVIIEVRDRGSGNRGEFTVSFDPLSPGFEIIPLRPVFNGRTKNILLLTDSAGVSDGATLSVKFHCLGDSRQLSKNAETLLGNVMVFTKPRDWNKCHVIMVQATRNIGTMKTRAKTLMIPNVADVSSVEPSWIELASSRVSYTVGETMEVTTQGSVERTLNYVVICNSHSVPDSGQVRDDGTLSIKITKAMIGQCILFAYTMDSEPSTDMVYFEVNEQCQVSAFGSRDSIEPGSSWTLTLNGEPYGIAVVRAIDDRLNALKTRNGVAKGKYWELGMFLPSEFNGNQAKLLNLVSLEELKKALERSCSSAASSYFQQFGRCPDVKMTKTALSNSCLKVMIAKCMSGEEPSVAVSTACDAKNPRNCILPIRKLTVGRIFAFELPHPPSAETSVDIFSDVEVSDEDRSDVRQHFPEVWLFEAIPLTASGSVTTTLKAPDTVGTWSISSVFWAPGQRDLCSAKDVQVISKKNVFLEVDLPKSVFVNETVTAKVSVIASDLSRETTYSVCLSEMSRKICADLGSFGQLGQPSYSRVVVSPAQPIDTKTFSLRFLSIGFAAVTFKLREETSFPGKHHCDVGTVYDSVRLKVFIARRDEAEVIYKSLVLDAAKPLADAKMNDAREKISASTDLFHVTEYRSPAKSDAIITDVHANILDADAVYSFTLDVCEFLPIQSLESDVRRRRRSIDYPNSFLTDILKDLSVELYRHKKMKMLQPSKLDISQNSIGSLVSDMLRFSDCRNESACGYAEYAMPRNPEERSVALTAIATSLLCEAGSDSRLVCGGIKFLIQLFLKEWREKNLDFEDLISLSHPVDSEWFLKAILLQVSRDCSAYQCVKDDEAWFKLLFSFYSIDENWKWDIRSIAALAFMGTNATSEVMRIKMAGMANHNILPFWNAGTVVLASKPKSNSFDESSLAKRMKSGDILVNSLGILAFISSGAEGQNLDWDPLASWLYEQQLEDGSYENVIDTYFASRALFEYHLRKVDISSREGATVTLRCDGCETRTVNVTESPTEIFLPSNTRNLTLETKGGGKAKVDIRIVAKKRQRSRRGLTQDDYYPVRLTVQQEQINKGTIRQTVCLRVLSPLVKVVELTHGLFTGYTAAPNSVAILANSTSLSFFSLPTVSSFAVHFVLGGFRPNEMLCYAVGVSEPQHSHEPLYLAPVAITARHPIDDVIGHVLISHPDQASRNGRGKRSTEQEQKASHEVLIRNIRGIVDETIDTVCFEGGQCSCAESTCGVKCGLCARDSGTDIRAFISKPQNFGAFVRVHTVNRVLVGSAFYIRLSTEVREKRGDAEHHVSEKLDVWIRECNPRCTLAPPAVNDNYFILGEYGALSVDNSGRQHYVLRNFDRFEKAIETCSALANVIVLG